jgi:zinc transport system ATP-binding protein
MGNAKPVLRMCGLTLGYNGNAVLTRLELTVRTGEFWFLLGPNGSGKSTLIKAMLGFLLPQAGEIWLNPELARPQCIGFVPQRCDFNPSLPTTVREFVLLGLTGIRAGRKEQAERLAWALVRVGLPGMERQDYWALSGGQRQRALVARALARHPRLLIMDEPTGGLDPAIEAALMDDLARLNQEEGMTVLCISHDLTAAARHASHVAVFYNGQITSGSAQEILVPEHIERVYGVRLKVPTKGPRDRISPQAHR